MKPSSPYVQPMSRLLSGEESGRQQRHRKPRKHERDTALVLGGRMVPASGSIPGMKGDVGGIRAQQFEFLTECKRTVGKSLAVQVSWLTKISSEARLRPGRSPALAMQFEAQDGMESDWVAVPRSVFARMLDALRDIDVE